MDNNNPNQLVSLADEPDAYFKYPVDLLRDLYDNADVGIYVSDCYTHEIIMCNDRYASYMRKTVDDVIGSQCYKVMGFDSYCPYCPYNDNGGQRKAGGSQRREHYFEDYGIWLQITGRVIRWVDGRLAHMFTLINVTERHKNEERLKLLAFRDRDLQIPNALCFERDLDSVSQGEELVVIQLRELRDIVSVYGKDLSNSLMREISDYINDMCIPNSTLYRMEAGDFAIRLKSDGLWNARSAAERLTERFRSGWNIHKGEERQTLSCVADICIMPLQRVEPDALYRAINYALYVARITNKITVFDKELEEKFERLLRMEYNFEAAVQNNMEGFMLEYQPVIDSNMATWVGVEALCRWQHDEFGSVSPKDFIPIAESCGLISAVGRWILDQAISQIKTWELDKISKFILSVNLSNFQLLSTDIDKTVKELLEKHFYPPEKFCVEIIRASEANIPYRVDVIRRLNAIGVMTALDDFGTGYDSFSSMIDLPVKVFKTDCSFINGLELNSDKMNLYRCIISLAHESGKRIVAKGVETENQVRQLFMLSADYFQGYFLSKPLSPEQMKAELYNFYLPSKELLSLVYDKAELTKPIGEEAEYELSKEQSKLLNLCMYNLFSNANVDAAVNSSLERFGQMLDISRACVLIKDDTGLYQTRDEWCAPGVDAKDMNILSAEWTGLLAQEGYLVAPDVHMLSDSVAEYLLVQDIKAVVAFSLKSDNKQYGLLQFEKHNDVRVWTREEVQMLHTLSNVISLVLSNARRKEASRYDHERVLNSMNTAIYVSDPDTYEVLFANSGLKQLYGDRQITGNICWQALRNRDKKCDFCPIDRLRNSPGESYEWEHYNEVLKRHFRIWDRMIQWTGDKQAHLQYAEDITDLVNSQKDVSPGVNLSKVLDKDELMSTLRHALLDAYHNNTITTIAYVGINFISLTNEACSYLESDGFMFSAIGELRKNIRGSDFMGHYDGDELVVVFTNCTKEIAELRLTNSLKGLMGLNTLSNVSPRFSYGLVESAELPYSDCDEYVMSLIETANMLMLEHKQLIHSNT